jgi:hypothetical protein
LVKFPDICSCEFATVEARVSLEDALVINGFPSVGEFADWIRAMSASDLDAADARVWVIVETMFQRGTE